MEEFISEKASRRQQYDTEKVSIIYNFVNSYLNKWVFYYSAYLTLEQDGIVLLKITINSIN